MAAVVTALTTVGLIFGGCCSNVFALEAIIKREPDSGLLITFTQFLFTAGAAYFTQISPPSLALKTRSVPLSKWAYIAVLFYSINMLNNWAFAFNISVPVHIILRSFGSVTTMLAGWLYAGKRYSVLQVVSVAILTVGVCVSAWADAAGKGKSLNFSVPSSTTTTDTSDFTSGLAILLLAQLLSAYMGIYVQETYAAHGSSWRENLFYSHFLSLPLFLPLAPTLTDQYARLAGTPTVNQIAWLAGGTTGTSPAAWTLATSLVGKLPSGIIFLLINALTQLACISGVNLLSAKSTAVTVTIVLNVRKLVSFVFSTWLFGHRMSGLMVLGAVLVFGSGALYGWETSWRIPKARTRKAGEVGEKQRGGKKM